MGRAAWTWAAALLTLGVLAWFASSRLGEERASVADDAYITYRYARNLAWGNGIRFNLGDEVPVEGYSNFLWLLLSALFEVLGVDPGIGTTLVSALLSGAAVGLTFHICRGVFKLDYAPSVIGGLSIALMPGWAVWSSSGLATVPFALLVLTTFHQFVLSRSQTWWLLGGLSAVALSLIRVEGIAWVGVLLALGVFARTIDDEAQTRNRWLSRIPHVLAILLPVFAIYTTWRYLHFQTLVPNTALVKVNFGTTRLLRGGLYVALFSATFPTMLTYFLGSIAAVKWKRGAGLAVVAMAIAFPTYAVVVGGDYMPFGRLLIPSIPFGGMLLAFLIHDLSDRVPTHRENVIRASILIVALGSLGGFNVHAVPKSGLELFHFRWTDRSFMTERERWDKMVHNTDGFVLRGKALRDHVPPETTMVAQAVGAVGYHSRLYIYDQYGLVTREVAERELPEGPSLQSPGHDKLVPPEWFLHQDPDLIRAKVVHGTFADKRVRDVMKFWDIPLDVRQTYVPEIMAISYPDEDEYLYLLLVRRVLDYENADEVWATFQRDLRVISDELKAVRREQKKQG